MSDLQIYLARNNEQAGPYTLEQLNQMLSSQQVLLTDLIWHQGMSEWKPLGEVTQGKYSYQPTHQNAQSTTPLTHTTANVEKQIQNRPLEEKSKQASSEANIGERFAAKLIDLFAWFPMFFIPSAFIDSTVANKIIQLNQQMSALIEANKVDEAKLIATQIFNVIPSFVFYIIAAYIVILLALQARLIAKSGQSIGKKVMSLQMIDKTTQQPIGVFRGFVIRSLVFIFLNLLFFPFVFIIDTLPIFFDKQKRTLHDFVAKTIVTKKK